RAFPHRQQGGSERAALLLRAEELPQLLMNRGDLVGAFARALDEAKLFDLNRPGNQPCPLDWIVTVVKLLVHFGKLVEVGRRSDLPGRLKVAVPRQVPGQRAVLRSSLQIRRKTEAGFRRPACLLPDRDNAREPDVAEEGAIVPGLLQVRLLEPH